MKVYANLLDLIIKKNNSKADGKTKLNVERIIICQLSDISNNIRHPSLIATEKILPIS